MSRIHLSAPARLTLTYAGLFLLTGIALAVVISTFTFWPVNPPADVNVIKNSADTNFDAALNDAIAIKAQARTELRTQLLTVSVISIGGMTIVAAVLGWIMAHRALRPVRTVSNAAKRLSETNLHERIPVTGPRDEMRELAETFNEMLARLEGSLTAQRLFIANASHELRGPMTTQRVLAEVARGDTDATPQITELTEALLGQLDRQERLVEGLLALASTENGVVEITDVDLVAITENCIRDLETEIGARQLTVHLDNEAASIVGDRVLIELLLSNLLRNAVVHNEPGGDIWIGIHARELTIENTGAVISAERLLEVMAPFRRGARDRTTDSGSGLGLAIANSAADVHQASLVLTPRRDGGVQARLQFPA